MPPNSREHLPPQVSRSHFTRRDPRAAWSVSGSDTTGSSQVSRQSLEAVGSPTMGLRWVFSKSDFSDASRRKEATQCISASSDYWAR